MTINLVKKSRNGNLFALSSSTGALSVGTANFTGGQDNAVICVTSICGTAGTDWQVGTTSNTAFSIASWMNSNPTLSAIIVSTAPTSSATVFSTATSLGTNAYLIYASTPAISIGSTQYLNGLATNIATAANEINIVKHGFVTGLPVLLTKTAQERLLWAIGRQYDLFCLCPDTSRSINAGWEQFPIINHINGSSLLVTPIVSVSTQTHNGRWCVCVNAIGFGVV